jgi:Zn-dependent peptidase ImmA (M78 family)
MKFSLRKEYVKVENWYVIDEEFPWPIEQVKEDIMSMQPYHKAPIIFCDTCDANDILLALGEEEEEFLFPMNGYYHPNKDLIFIFTWDTYEQLLATLLHEIHHHMQFQNKRGKMQYQAERHLPYEARSFEKDAREFAREKMLLYKQKMNRL